MDPNVTLEEIRQLMACVLDGEMDDVAEQLAEAFLSLDEWLTKKGFLPDEWRPMK